MEHAIVHNDLAKEDIKPSELIHQFIKYVSAFNQENFQQEKLALISCPACHSRTIDSSFIKLELQYLSCASCRTIYLNPRPSQKEIKQYFTEAEARQFWLKNVWMQTADVRRSKILEPFLDWVQVFVGQYFQDRSIRVAELYPIHWGLLEMWREKRLQGEYVLVDPYFAESLCPIQLGNLCLPFSTEKKFDVICLPDTLAWVEKPRDLFQWVAGHLNPNGLCFLTTIFSSGFDVMILKERASYFVPPERLNLFSFEALNSLVKQFPFEMLECSTPGVLDMQNIHDAYRKNNTSLPSFIKYIFEMREPNPLFDSFQEFLQANRLSSQGRMVLQKGS